MTVFRYVDRIATSLEFQLLINISEELVATIFCLEFGDGRFLQLVDRYEVTNNCVEVAV
jgi:hypothetical protein